MISTLYIPELNIEIETKLHEEMDRVSKIVIPNGWRLLELSELIFIYNNYQDKFNWGKDKFFDEITQQPIKDCKYPYWNVWLRRLDGVVQSFLYGDSRGLILDDAVRGVRFCRDIKTKRGRKMSVLDFIHKDECWKKGKNPFKKKLKGGKKNGNKR